MLLFRDGGLTLPAMKVYFQRGSPLDRLETDSEFDAGFTPETVTMYRRRIQQLRASLSERDILQSRALDMRPVPKRGDDFFSIFVCHGMRLVIHLLGSEPRREVAVLEILQVKQPVRRIK
jgi:plasmid maintenance system killer protein